MMSDIVEFLLARIAEDEEIVSLVVRSPQRLEIGEPWHCDEQSNHVALAPNRLRRECDVKRRIVELHRMCGRGGKLLCRELASIGSVYADHPDYRAEWKP